HGARHRADRIDVKIAGLAVEPCCARSNPGLGPHRPDMAGPEAENKHFTAEVAEVSRWTRLSTGIVTPGERGCQGIRPTTHASWFVVPAQAGTQGFQPLALGPAFAGATIGERQPIGRLRGNDE